MYCMYSYDKIVFFLMSIISGNPELVLFVYFDLRLLQKTRHFLRCKTKTNRDMLKYLFTHFREFASFSTLCSQWLLVMFSLL